MSSHPTVTGAVIETIEKHGVGEWTIISVFIMEMIKVEQVI